MREIENQCVGCETCTLGSGCPLLRVEVITCDVCGDEAKYSIDDQDYCADCAAERLKEIFDSLSIEEQAEVLDVNCKRID